MTNVILDDFSYDYRVKISHPLSRLTNLFKKNKLWQFKWRAAVAQTLCNSGMHSQAAFAWLYYKFGGGALTGGTAVAVVTAVRPGGAGLPDDVDPAAAAAAAAAAACAAADICCCCDVNICDCCEFCELAAPSWPVGSEGWPSNLSNSTTHSLDIFLQLLTSKK